MTQLLRGEPVDVLEELEGWARIRTAYDYPGWVRGAALGQAEDGEWLVRREGDVVAEARCFIGAPYEWGGMTERGIDCSGLIHMSFRRLGVLVPRDSMQQEEAGAEVAADDLRPGDVVFYEGHCAFWLAPGRILHATEREGVAGVVEEPEPDELRTSFRSYRRLLTD